ncbi:PREDICTED: uncharacterized protein LOC106814834 [Priapulus caudatus]|uniref:Uncharacterized protein LOC106814834 n=1 Tax=Priapulus caudatus TaxID=37621 RepID=A0ABM1ER58_PRICU|nr:PREDICTED: uncharacterized protein LOC106814834 [Priapulus caudatus]
MKKMASYKVDICIDKEAVIEEGQCECGAGQGPTAHCKHIAAVLFGLTSFRNAGSILTELTCTQVLQTFHKAKVYKGSPMKSDDFEAIRGKEGSSLVFDPRPRHMRNSVNSTNRFRNTYV